VHKSLSKPYPLLQVIQTEELEQVVHPNLQGEQIFIPPEEVSLLKHLVQKLLPKP
jgi:hypothetical protein